MRVVRVEFHSARTGHVKTIGTAVTVNDGSGRPDSGN